MKLSIKSKPEDFIVEELVSLPFEAKGGFAAYLLKKRNRNTVELLSGLSRKLNIPFKSFSYGGRKDRHALTSQYIAIKSRKISELKEDDYSLRFCGFMRRAMGPDFIKGNRFEITIRRLTQKDVNEASKEIAIVGQTGYCNYFDDQRFGSFDALQGFFAEKVLKAQFNGALKIYLTSINAQERSEEKERKRYFYKNWKDWNACKKIAATAFEKKAFSHLADNPDGFLPLLKQIPREELANYFSAYQSFIWNEVLRRIIINKAEAHTKLYPGAAGDYLFYPGLEEAGLGYLENLLIPTLPVRVKIEDGLCAEIYSQVLEANGIKTPMFNKLKLRQAFFKSTLRKAVVKPQGLSFQASEDELNTGKKKLVLNFTLARGSYGTMLVKRLFSKD